MKKKFILVSSLFFSMSINEVFSGNLCYPTNSFYNSSSINAQSICIVQQNTSVYNEESEFEIPTISTKGLEWKTPNVSELRNRTREHMTTLDKLEKVNAILDGVNNTIDEMQDKQKTMIIMQKKLIQNQQLSDAQFNATMRYISEREYRFQEFSESLKQGCEEIIKSTESFAQNITDNYLPTIIEQMNDLKSRISVVYEQERKFAKKLLAITSIPSKLFQGTSYCVSRVKDFAVSIYQNMKSFITNSVTSLRQKIN